MRRVLLLLAVTLFPSGLALADCSWTTPSSTSIMYTSNCDKVGIGSTTSPSDLLHLRASSPSIRIEDTASVLTPLNTLLGTNSSLGTFIETDTDSGNNSTRNSGAVRISMGYTGIDFSHSPDTDVSDPRTWDQGLHWDMGKLRLDNPTYDMHEIDQTVSTSSQVLRTHYNCGSLGGLSLNASFNCTNTSLDNTDYAGWFLMINNRSGDSNGDYFEVRRTPPGTNPHTDDLGLFKISYGGDVIARGSVTGNGYDLAEWVPASTPMKPGTVVVLNRSKPNEVMPSSHAYDTAVAGVVSEKPGLILGQGSSSKEMIVATGRVNVRVDATRHPIRVGDLLVTSDKPGVAMLSEPVDVGGIKIHRPGTLIGKALEPLSSGEGEILVLIALQ